MVGHVAQEADSEMKICIQTVCWGRGVLSRTKPVRVRKVQLGKEKSSRNVVATEALANPTGSSEARMALQNHPKLWQGSQAFDITSTNCWCWLLARSRGRDLSMASPWKVHTQEQFLKRDPKASATYTPGCRPEGRVWAAHAQHPGQRWGVSQDLTDHEHLFNILLPFCIFF